MISYNETIPWANVQILGPPAQPGYGFLQCFRMIKNPFKRIENL